MKPLFMWAGGKTKMMRHYAPLMPSSVKSYSEPFFGGGAMLIKVMETHSPSLVRINDINKDIMGIYRAIRDDCPNFMKSMDLHQQRYIPLSKEDRKKLFYEIRHEHAWDHQKWSPTEQAATLYFLMKTAFNGIWQVNRNTNGRFGASQPEGCGLRQGQCSCMEPHDGIHHMPDHIGGLVFRSSRRLHIHGSAIQGFLRGLRRGIPRF
jgi:DNA adenine methylase Dam